MRPAAIVILLLLALACSRNPPMKYAIVYGISDYPYVGIDLPYSANDAESVRRLFESYGYSVILRKDTAATLGNLEADIDRVANVINENDLFAFYFSGHGVGQSAMLEIGDTAVETGYFAMLMYHKATYGDISEYVRDNGLTKARLDDLIKRVPTGVKCAVIDACYSGLLINKTNVVDYTPDDYNGEKVNKPDFEGILRDAAHIYKKEVMGRSGQGNECLTITSSGGGEISWDGFFSHSVFTYFWLMAAEQGDIDGDGVITALEAYVYTRAAFEKYWNSADKDADWNYLPQITGGSEDIVMFEHASIIGKSILTPE
jgi:hypothetical protein